MTKLDPPVPSQARATLIAEAEKLIDKWRAEGKKLLGEDLGVSLVCADELESLLTLVREDVPQLMEYARHKDGCALLRCQFMYGTLNRCQQPVDSSDHDPEVWPDAHRFAAGSCSCGLDQLLSREDVPQQEQERQTAQGDGSNVG